MGSNLRQAKAVDIIYFLSKQGITPRRETSSRAYYLSPFREETSPSFIVYKNENKFYDWGEKWGGDVIDIAERIWDCKTSDAIYKLLNNGEEVPQYHKRPAIIDRTPQITIIEESDTISNETLIEYMETIRKVGVDVLNRYCSEVWFQFASSKSVSHVGAAMKNDVGGYSIRSTWFKGSTSPAGVTTVLTNDTDSCYLFEGFLDFMSHVVLWGEPEHTSIILNSTVFVNILMDFLSGFG